MELLKERLPAFQHRVLALTGQASVREVEPS
jgi:hypothetical protein